MPAQPLAFNLSLDDSSLTDEDMQGTFATGDTWTVQRSVDMGEPVETPVKSAVFAGR